MKPLVYIAAPYTYPDPIANTRVAAEAWHRLWASGLVAPVCPHLSMLLHFHKPLTWEEWITYDLEVLARCDAVLRLPGESKGADREVREAEKRRMPVYHQIDTLFADVQNSKLKVSIARINPVHKSPPIIFEDS